MNEAPEGWVVYCQRDQYAPGVVLYTVWASTDGAVEIRPSGGKFMLEAKHGGGRLGLFTGGTREACVAWWAIEQSNEPTNYIKGQSGAHTYWDEVGSITLEALNGLLED